MNRLSNPSILKVAALVGVLLALLLLASTISAQASLRSYRYVENGTDPIATFRATTDVKWTVGGVDADIFDISPSGVLTFKSSPNYEDPEDVARPATNLNSDTGDTDTDDPGEAADPAENNIYYVDIVADGTTLVNAIVTVADMDDPGRVSLSHLQPAEGVAYEADAFDEDDGLRNPANNKLWEAGETDAPALGDPATRKYARWKWERSQDGSTGWSVIPDEDSSSYTPKTADVGYYLRVTATYSDRDLDNTGADNSATATDNRAYARNAPVRTASDSSDYPVKQANNVNQTPSFADDDMDTDGKQQDRKVDENSPKGTVVGAPVSAADTDVLKYEWTTTGTGAGETSAETKDAFKVDRATGQISVNGTLNFEGDPSYTGTVIATDPYKSTDTVTVTIMLNDVNDKPTFADGAPTAGTVTEITATQTTRDITPALTYSATDVDDTDTPADGTADEVVRITKSGPDASAFDLATTDGTGSAAATGTLTFAADTEIDYETKKSYSVTIVATDGRGLSATVDVTITVENSDDAGSIKLSTRQPQVGRPIRADLTDADGVKGSITWTWTTGDATSNACPEGGAYTDTIGEATDDRDNKQTFTPQAGDVTVASGSEPTCLLVTAGYEDELGASKTATRVTYNPVLPQRSSNRAPEFEDQDPDTDGTQNSSATRSVAENTPSGTEVGSALVANDKDKNLGGVTGLNDMPTYSLRGADASYFKIDDGTGQIEVKVKLNHEDKDTHNVIVRATDGSGADAEIPVTITVTDVNEEPEVIGLAAVTFQENGTGDVGTYTADDPEDDSFTWSVGGDDGKKFFSIDSNGVLMFKSPPNFEAKADMDKNNVYEVTVIATDTKDQAGMKSVKVTVTNTDDPASITFDVVQPGVGVQVTAKLNDHDVADEEAGATYQWEISDSASGPFAEIANETKATYTPKDGDAGKHLQVTATYGPFGGKKTLSKGFGAEHPVAARDVANAAPVFPDQNPAAEGPQTAQEREVPENSPRGTLVGDPVVATDDDVRTYTVDDDADSTTAFTEFTIDMATGQLKVGSATMDFEIGYTKLVVVTATDANGASTPVDVTIIATNLDEEPELEAPTTTAENSAAPEGQKLIDADGDVTDAELSGGFTPTTAATYTASDPEGGNVMWSVEGADGDKFEITPGTNADGDSTGTLVFKSNPDYEAMGSVSGTDTYKVTIVASDQAGNRNTMEVKVKVTNVDEPGEITFGTVQPQVGVPITATLSEPDGVVGSVMWTWDSATTPVPGTTTNTFIPVTANEALTVTVSYTDKQDRTATRSVAVSDIQNIFNVRTMQTSNRAPKFVDGEGATVTEKVREIRENTDAGTDVGLRVDARDDDTEAGTTNSLTYTMGGPDAASFTIVRGNPTGDGNTGASTEVTTGGQIKTKAKLDYETKSVYTVTVTATDGSGASAMVTVTINITDQVTETPELAPDAPVISGDDSPSYEEGGTAAVGTYTVVPTDATLSLGGDDMAALSLDPATGELSFDSTPDFEAPGDADGDNVYMVTITATDAGTSSDPFEVAITVTNMDEDGSISFDISEPSVGTPIEATLSDPDGGVTNETWQWQRSDAQGDFSDIDGATMATYTPVAEDGGFDLRVMASYDDAQGTGKMATSVQHQVSEMADYDANGDGVISRDEAIKAVQDYFANKITRDQVLAVIQQYFAGLGS